MFCRAIKAVSARNGHISVCRLIHTTPANTTFWEREKKSGYSKPPSLPETITKNNILNGLTELKQEIALWKAEIKEKFQTDPIFVNRPGEIDVVWQFSESGEHLIMSSFCNLRFIIKIIFQIDRILING